MLILEIAFTVNTVHSAAFNVHSVVLWFHRAAKMKKGEKSLNQTTEEEEEEEELD